MSSLKIKARIATPPFKTLLISLFLIVTLSFSYTTAGAVWYVNGDLGTSGGGTNWNTAFLTIQEAINAASEGDEIWIKKGTYPLCTQITVDTAVDIYGGFAGSETQRDERDWSTNVTTIDGQGSVYHCFYVTADTTIDGLTITGGNANGDVPDQRGGGMYSYQASPTITNCTLTGNSAEFGGGIYNRKSSPSIMNCIFMENAAVNYGGAIENYQSSPTIDKCTISKNTAQKGGGIYNDQSSPTISDCTLSKNNSTESGGGIYSRESLPIITNCTFKDNISDFGGGILNGAESTSMISNCSFTGNTAVTSGGGMYIDTSSPAITNCILSDNSATYGGALYNDNSFSVIVNCTLSNNSATNNGGAIRNKDASTSTITNTILWANTAPDGPEIYNDDTSTPTITFCDIQGGYVGQGNINSDPLFVNPSNGDFHLTVTSPCIDKGNNSASALPDNDFEGDQRIIDSDNDSTATVDMGADEYTPSVTPDGDVAPLGNRDGKVDVGDALVALRFALLLETPTQEDIQHGDVAPLDASGVPQPDGNIDVGDALVILRKALGMISFEPTAISGIWGLYTTTTSETQEGGPMTMIVLESDGTLPLEIMDLDGTWIPGTGSISGTQISFSWEEEGATVSLTGIVTNGIISGTWTDTSGSSGTWRAQRVLELGEAEITFPETGDVLIKIEEEFGLGSATFYGTQTDQGPAFPLTGFTMTTSDGDCMVSLDDQEQPLTMTLGTMEVTFTYNEDDSFNYELKEDGVIVYSGAAISPGGGNNNKSVLSRADTLHHSVGISSLPTQPPLRYGRSNGDEEAYTLEDFVNDIIEDRVKRRFHIDRNHPFVKKMKKNPQVVSLVNIIVMNVLLSDRLKKKHGEEKARNAIQFLLDFTKLFIGEPADDIAALEWDNYNGGNEYDFDKDGFTENDGDCNDRNKKIYPGAPEYCNGIDDDCDDTKDEGVTITFYLDSDGDTYGNPGISIQACKQPSHYVTDNTDCDDLDSSRNPGAAELCDDTKDNDCDKLTDCDDSDCDTHPSCQPCPDPQFPQWCDGECIPAGAVCCHDSQGGWCPAGSVCIDEGCCPFEWLCDGIICRPEGYVCCNTGDGAYCPPEFPKCCPSKICCASDSECCGHGCCEPGYYCCSDKSQCCKQGYICCNGGGCCKKGTECCGTKCCGAGMQCVGGKCVPE